MPHENHKNTEKQQTKMTAVLSAGKKNFYNEKKIS